MHDTRRKFLKHLGVGSAAIAGGAILPRQLLSQRETTRILLNGGGGFSQATLPLTDIRDPSIKALALRGLDAARAAGASYADIRLTRQRDRQLGFAFGVNEKVEQMVGVRAFVNGYWGFASAAIWDGERIAYLGQEAVRLAKTNSLGKSRAFEFVSAPALSDEHWAMPVEIDPFDIPIAEVVDFKDGLVASYRAAHEVAKKKYPSYRTDTSQGIPVLKDRIGFWKQEKAFASTEGSYGTQILYRTDGDFGSSGGSILGAPEFRIDFLTPTGAGWELFTKGSLHESIDQALERYMADSQLPVKPTEVGRYTVAFDAESITRFATGTIGIATELDRALGYEANATGTSYLISPFEMLGSFKIGSPALTVTVNRNEPGAVGTVGWDDEGVRPTSMTLVENGILQNMQTTRESASWLHQTHPQLGAQSSGSAVAITGSDEPICQTANIAITPSTAGMSYEDMVKSIDNGIVFENFNVIPDFQQLSGAGFGRAYEVKDGKKVAMLRGAAILFRTPEFWNSLTDIGNPESVKRFGYPLNKGTPGQTTYHSVSAPPMKFKDITVVDIRRR